MPDGRPVVERSADARVGIPCAKRGVDGTRDQRLAKIVEGPVVRLDEVARRRDRCGARAVAAGTVSARAVADTCRQRPGTKVEVEPRIAVIDRHNVDAGRGTPREDREVVGIDHGIDRVVSVERDVVDQRLDQDRIRVAHLIAVIGQLHVDGRVAGSRGELGHSTTVGHGRRRVHRVPELVRQENLKDARAHRDALIETEDDDAADGDVGGNEHGIEARGAAATVGDVDDIGAGRGRHIDGYIILTNFWRRRVTLVLGDHDDR